MKDELSRDDIYKYLEELNQYLKAEGKYGEIILVGGAALTLKYNARESTHDIDAIFHPKEDLRPIIQNIAATNDLPEDWLNDGAKGFVTSKMSSSELYRLSNLNVHCMDAECLLAMKLTSARTYSKDRADSIFLMKKLNIQSQEELFDIVD